jgi:hypothetical protein
MKPAPAKLNVAAVILNVAMTRRERAGGHKASVYHRATVAMRRNVHGKAGRTIVARILSYDLKKTAAFGRASDIHAKVCLPFGDRAAKCMGRDSQCLG